MTNSVMGAASFAQRVPSQAASNRLSRSRSLVMEANYPQGPTATPDTLAGSIVPAMDEPDPVTEARSIAEADGPPMHLDLENGPQVLGLAGYAVSDASRATSKRFFRWLRGRDA